MAWNQVTLLMHPPGWTSEVRDSSLGVTAKGDLVRILSDLSEANVPCEPVSRREVADWLKSEGFAAEPNSERQFGRGLVKLGQITETEIVVCVGGDHSNVSSLLVRLALSREAPSRVGDWYELVTRIADRWGLTLYHEGAPVELTRFFEVLTGDPKWSEFKEYHGW